MKKVNILAIGNSFSQDATHYLYQIITAAGIDVKVVNLYIGGCPLERHWQNIESRERAYQYQLNGMLTEKYVSIDEALDEENWNFIITQQASHDSGWMVTYEPFLGLLVNYLHEKVPGAELYLQETWAYEIDSKHGCFMRYNRNQQEMYDKLRMCYYTMADKYKLGLIPCGDIIQKVREVPEFHVRTGGLSLCRDGFHMSYGYGRYLLAATWARKLLGVSAKENLYIPASVCLDAPVDLQLLEIIKKAVDDGVKVNL